jgi:hypothetical protein
MVCDCGAEGPAALESEDPATLATDEGWGWLSDRDELACPVCIRTHIDRVGTGQKPTAGCANDEVWFSRDKDGFDNLASFLAALQREDLPYELRQDPIGRVIVRLV